MAVASHTRVLYWRRRSLLLPAFAASVTAQAMVLFAYAATRPTPKPYLSIRLDGEGAGQVLVTRLGDRAPILRYCNAEVLISTRAASFSGPLMKSSERMK